MSLDWNNFKKEKAVIDFMTLCEKFETLDTLPGLRTELINYCKLISINLNEEGFDFEALYEAAKIMYLADFFLRENGIIPTDQQLIYHSSKLLNFIKHKEETVRQLMSGSTIH